MNFQSKIFKKLNEYCWWIQAASSNPSRSKKLLINLDKIAFEAEKRNLKTLQEKIKKFCSGPQKNYLINNGDSYQSIITLDKKEREMHRQLFDFFTELMVYSELRENNFEDILFIPEERVSKPDIQAKKNNKKFFFEVKNLNPPRNEEESLITTGWYTGDINIHFKENMKKKINYFICDACKKFNSLKNVSEKVLVINYQEGIDAIVEIEPVKRDLDGILGNDYFLKIEKENNITVWRRKYF